MDSYQEFITHFNIDKEKLFEWGISSTIFPSIDKVTAEWENLKYRIFHNEVVYIRKYGPNSRKTKLYIDFYVEFMHNTNVRVDVGNNTIPHKVIQRTTGMKRNKDLYNYQVSHIWGHTKNVFLFEAPWNMCYTPKIMDPFTGHETKGIWPKEYQRRFYQKATDVYRPFVEEYNQIMKELNAEKRLQEYIVSLNGSVPEGDLLQFAKDSAEQFTPILL